MKREVGTAEADLPHDFASCGCLDEIGDRCECCHVCGQVASDTRHDVATDRQLADGVTLARELGSVI